jgi:hypothetical protein
MRSTVSHLELGERGAKLNEAGTCAHTQQGYRGGDCVMHVENIVTESNGKLRERPESEAS